MSYPHSHKTVLVLDHGAVMAKSSQHFVDFDVFTKSRTAPGLIPLAPITKSLWTCNVEACMEYSRIVYDIFPQDRLIAIVSSDSDATLLTSWTLADQNLQQHMSALGRMPPPTKSSSKDSDDSTVKHGLSQALELLSEPSEKQTQLLRLAEDDVEAAQVINRGRIVCLTSLKSDKHGKMLEDWLLDALLSHNKLAASSKNLLVVDHCELVVVHVVPLDHDSRVSHSPPRQLSSAMTSEIHVTQSGKFVAAKMVGLAVSHYNLSSTTVTGIPMKEEQNASSSANYDVELLHPFAVHADLCKTGHAEELIISSKEGLMTDTVCLKWCTPKNNNIELHQCTESFRITPVDVNSRPSSCLTNFLLNGRAVMLEQPRKSGSKVISHMLCSHGGEIYIHTLNNARSTLEDPPSISEGCGGRITDYRISDFGELMKETRVAPAADATHLEQNPIERAKAQLERMTRHWPLTIGDTIVFNMLSHVDPLPFLLLRDQLTEEELLDCKKVIYHLVGLETRGEALPLPSPGSRGKGSKREEQYRQMWNELERLIRAHSGTSPNHQAVLECLLNCRSSSGETSGSIESRDVKKETAEDALKTYDRYQKMTEREKQEMNSADVKRDTDAVPPKKMKTEPYLKTGTGGQSLLSMWSSRISTLHSARCAEFSAREDTKSNRAELYKDLHQKNTDNGASSSSTSLPSAMKKS